MKVRVAERAREREGCESERGCLYVFVLVCVYLELGEESTLSAARSAAKG